MAAPTRGALQRHDHDVVRLARAAADEVDALAVGCALGQRRLRHRLALARLQQLDLPLAHLLSPRASTAFT